MAFAQDYPSRVIRIVASNSAGTPPDILARIAASALTDGEGWKVIVENKPGGVGTIAANEVLRQEADGHTLFSVSAPITAVPALLPNASFNLETDFAPVIHFATGYNVLVVNPKLPVQSVSELIEFLKKNPDKHTFSSGGFGTPAHLLGEMFKLETGVKTTHVPYNQFPQAIADLLSGVNSYQFITALPVVQHINSGALRALAVMSNKRVAALKDVPTIVEAGYPKLAVRGLGGLRGQIRDAACRDRAPERRSEQGAQDREGSRVSRQDGRRCRRRHTRRVRRTRPLRDRALD